MGKKRSALVSLIVLISLVLCGCGPGQSAGPPSTPAPPVPIVFDDDGSADGTTALFYLFVHPRADLKSVSISYGEAHPEVYIQHIGQVLDSFGMGGLPLGYGQDAPLAGSNAFPDMVRQASDDFWGLPLASAGQTYPAQPAPEMIVSVIQQSPQPVTIFMSGPATNLAQALRLEAGIKGNIAAVYIMGGAVYVPGNIRGLIPASDNETAEWNIFADPQAADELFTSGLSLYLVPLDATNRLQITARDTAQWQAGGNAAGLAADIYDSVFFDPGASSAPIWDLMTAAIMLEPDLCEFKPLHLQVVTQPGANSGQTRVATGGEPNINVCLKPDAKAILQSVDSIFSGSGK